MWQYLSDAIKDDEGAVPHRKPTNRSYRFDVADKINALLSPSPKASGRFGVPPFQTAQGFLIQPLRLTDQRARSGIPFRLFGTASVGSQSLTGIPRLQNLRLDPTGCRKALPSCMLKLTPSVRVRSMWDWARDWIEQDQLWFEFSRPADIDPGSKEDIAIQLTEGWILGALPTVRHH